MIPNAFSKRIAILAEIDECPFSRVLRAWRENLVKGLGFHARKQLLERVVRLQDRLDDEPTALLANLDFLTDIQCGRGRA